MGGSIMRIKKKFPVYGIFVIVSLFLVIAACGSAMGEISTTPGDLEKDVSVDADIIITFEKPMDINTVEVTLDPDSGITITREWSNTDTKLKLVLSDSLSYDQIYTVSAGGNQTDTEFVGTSFTFTTESEPIILFGLNLQEPLPLIGFSLWNLIMFIVVLIVGLIVVKIVGRSVKKSLLRGKATEILAEFTSRLIKIMLTIFVVFTALGFLGLDIGEYILGLAVVLGFVLGFALGDTLSNIAAGFMIAITKPFKSGDVVTVSGETGAIQSVGISVTEMNTPDNKRIIIPNKSVWGGNIINFTRHGKRRVDMEVGVGYNDDLNLVIKTTMDVIKAHPKILTDPAPQVAVSDHGDSAVGLVVRPWCKTEDYWDVLFDMKKALKEAYDEAGISIPYPQMDLHVEKDI
jgi:small-conductance mechanosensitive channel